MSFSDIFKSSFLENVTAISIVDAVIGLVLAFIIGLFIYFVYQKTYNGVMYSTGFGITLVALTMITTILIMAVTSNVVLSLGMVGALSIVRFRTAIKEPMDIAFLFWSLAMGIILGAGLMALAILGSVILGIFMLVFVNRRSSDNPYILVTQMTDDYAEQLLTDFLKDKVKKLVVKSKTISENGVELTIEVRLKEASTTFVNEASAINGVKQVVLVSYNGDYMA